MNFDTNNWQEFMLSDLFEIKKGKRLTSDDQEDGKYNYIGAIDSNNGVANHISQKPIHKSNTITLSYNGSVGEAFYQKEPYWATDDVNALYSNYENFNEYIAFFIVTILKKEKFKFSYGRKWTLENMKKSIIKLPVKHNTDGTLKIDYSFKYSSKGYIPDWDFMEKYIKSLHYKPLKTANKPRVNDLKVEDWKYFQINRLFSISVANSADLGNLEEGNTIFVGRTDIDNGVQGYVQAKSITKGHCLTISMVGTNIALYQKDDFQASQNIAVLRNNRCNTFHLLFISTIINKEMKLKYSYGRTVGKSNLEQMSVKLPVKFNQDNTVFIDDSFRFSDDGYVPDWEFMEKYIKLLPYGDRL